MSSWNVLLSGIFKFSFTYVCVYACVSGCMHIWRPEVNVECLLLSTLFETGSFIGPQRSKNVWTDWPIISWDLFVTGSHHEQWVCHQLLGRYWQSEHRSSCMHSKYLTHGTISLCTDSVYSKRYILNRDFSSVLFILFWSITQRKIKYKFLYIFFPSGHESQGYEYG